MCTHKYANTSMRMTSVRNSDPKNRATTRQDICRHAGLDAYSVSRALYFVRSRACTQKRNSVCRLPRCKPGRLLCLKGSLFGPPSFGKKKRNANHSIIRARRGRTWTGETRPATRKKKSKSKACRTHSSKSWPSASLRATHRRFMELTRRPRKLDGKRMAVRRRRAMYSWRDSRKVFANVRSRSLMRRLTSAQKP
jgi:hypothetical protein